jgi:hypothetical protein
VSAFEKWVSDNLRSTSVVVIIAIAALVATSNHLAWMLAGLILASLGIIANIAWGRRGRMWPYAIGGSAIAVALGTVLCILAVTPTRSVVIIRNHRELVTVSPTLITISEPTPGSGVGPTPTVSGLLRNMKSNDFVMEFSQPFTTQAVEAPENFVSPYESCDISSDRVTFTCPSVFNGQAAGDYCRQALLWVTVVDSRQLAQLKADLGEHVSIVWPNRPVNLYGAADSVLVHRNPAPGHPSCLASP